jgi:cell division protein FtsQ
MRLRLDPHSRSAGPRDNPRKARRARKTRRRAVVAALAAMTVAGAAAGGWHMVATGRAGRTWDDAAARALRGSASAGLAVSEVVVEGRTHAGRADLLKALGVVRGMPILAFDPDAARQRVEALGWIKRAAVARRLPDVVFVRIEERVPLALWQRKGKLQLVDRDGVVVVRQDIAAFAGLPLIVGDDAPQHAAALFDLLTAFPEIAGQTDAAIRVSGRRWNLRLASGIDIRLPEQGIASALGRLADLHRAKNVLDRDIVAVDLRKPDRLIVRVSPEARDRIGNDGKNT